MSKVNYSDHNCDRLPEMQVTDFLQIGEGRGRDILLVGESFAPNGWVKSGRAFYREDGTIVPSGVYLNKLLADFDLSFQTCCFTDLIKCVVGKDMKLAKACGKKNAPFFKEQVNYVNPKLIVLLGKTTLDIFCETYQGEFEMGKPQILAPKIDRVHYVLPIYHPSPINPNSFKRNTKILNEYSDFILNLWDAE